MPSSGKFAKEGKATKEIAGFMYFTMHNTLLHKKLMQEAGNTLVGCKYSLLRRTVSGRKQPGSLMIKKRKDVRGSSSSRHSNLPKNWMPDWCVRVSNILKSQIKEQQGQR